MRFATSAPIKFLKATQQFGKKGTLSQGRHAKISCFISSFPSSDKKFNHTQPYSHAVRKRFWPHCRTRSKASHCQDDKSSNSNKHTAEVVISHSCTHTYIHTYVYQDDTPNGCSCHLAEQTLRPLGSDSCSSPWTGVSASSRVILIRPICWEVCGSKMY